MSCSWYDIMEEEIKRGVRMSPSAWRTEVNRRLRLAPQGQIVQVLADLIATEKKRGLAPSKPAPVSADERDWNLWLDMVNEPEKYGSDITDWLDLDAKVRSGPKRWRAAALWARREQEILENEAFASAHWRAVFSPVASEAAFVGARNWAIRDVKRQTARIRNAVVTIQAAVRGHQVRTSNPHLNCCMCLSHRISPLETDVGMMCHACAEQGPYEDITGPLSDPWNWCRA